MNCNNNKHLDIHILCYLLLLLSITLWSVCKWYCRSTLSAGNIIYPLPVIAYTTLYLLYVWEEKYLYHSCFLTWNNTYAYNCRPFTVKEIILQTSVRIFTWPTISYNYLWLIGWKNTTIICETVTCNILSDHI